MLRLALLAYGILNAVLYAGLLPLWEGFDEPFHYANVQELSRRATLPDLRHSTVSREIWDSLDVVPVSEGVHRNIPKALTFGDYFRLPADRRAELRHRLQSLDPRTAALPSPVVNYEAHQAPLAYLVLAPVDALAGKMPLTVRVLLLRLFCAIAAVLLTGWGMLRLAGQLGIGTTFADAAIFVVFSSPMFYAATAHIANDWLAVALVPLLLAEAVALYRKPRLRTAILFSLLFAAALLTKAYFLALLPIAVWLGIVRHRAAFLGLLLAAPWYVRNLSHNGNLTGMQETAAGTPVGELFAAAIRLPWLQTAWSTAHSALFTGNNSYLAFSAVTLTLMLAVLLAGAVLYLRRPIPAAERIVLAAIGLMAAAIAASTVIAFWASHGASTTPAPWYWQVLLPPAMLLLIRSRWIAIALVAIYAYFIAAAYTLKFLPYYAGLSDGRTHLADLPGWCTHFPSETLFLLPSPAVLTLTALVTVCAFGLAATLVRTLKTL